MITAGNVGYAAWRDGGFTIHDMSDPAQPKLISRRNYSPPFGGGAHTPLPFAHRKLLVLADEHRQNGDPDRQQQPVGAAHELAELPHAVAGERRRLAQHAHVHGEDLRCRRAGGELVDRAPDHVHELELRDSRVPGAAGYQILVGGEFLLGPAGRDQLRFDLAEHLGLGAEPGGVLRGFLGGRFGRDRIGAGAGIIAHRCRVGALNVSNNLRFHVCHPVKSHEGHEVPRRARRELRVRNV